MTRVRSLDRTDLLSVVMLAALTVVAIVLSAHYAGRGHGSALGPIAGVAIALGAFAVIPSDRRMGVSVGILIVAGLNSFPGPNLDTTFKLGLTRQEVVVIILLVVLGVDVVVHRLWRVYGTALGASLLLAALINLAWWLYTLLRTSAIPGVVLSHAVSFAWDFLFVLLLVPLLAASLQRRETRLATLATVGILSMIPASCYVVGSLAHVSFDGVIHPVKALTSGDLTRLYAPAQDLFPAVFAMSSAMAILGHQPRWRSAAALIAAVNFLAILAGQTRAQYLAVVLGLIVASVLFLRGPWAARAVWRLLGVVSPLAMLIAILLLAFPHIGPSRAITHFGDRIGSTFSAVTSSNSSTSTVAARTNEATLLEQRLGSHWPLGLGFISPRDMYDANLPLGTIRNADVGLLNSVMTMGVVGTILYYISILSVTVRLIWVSRLSRHTTGPTTWLQYGALIGLIEVLASSVTLLTFFSTTGVVSVATVIALGTVPLAPSGASTATDSVAR